MPYYGAMPGFAKLPQKKNAAILKKRLQLSLIHISSINDDGMFTEKGYIYNNRNTFTEWYDGRDVPEEYRVTPQPPQPERCVYETG